MFGKAGRAETSTDPAPFSMMETTIQLKPQSEWREKKRWYSSWAPAPLKWLLRHVWPDRISYEELIALMDEKLQIPGNSNAWTMPIKGRIDMLTTGVRTPVGIKIFGSDLNEIQRIGGEIEAVLKKVSGTRSVFAERVGGGFYVDLIPKREALARYGLNVDDFQEVVMSAIGGDTVSTTIEGRERYSINVRYPRELRTQVDELERVFITTMDGMQVPMKEVADIKLTYGPSMIRDENGRLAGYVYVDIADRDIGSYVDEAKQVVKKSYQTAHRLYPRLERPVRKHAARGRAAENRIADNHPVHIRAAVHEHEVGIQGRRGHAGRAFFRRGGGLAHVRARISYVDRRLGRHDRAHGA